MATYYVDYDTGSDANNGTTVLTPWKYDPEATSATGVSAGTTLQPDDFVVFKGGVTNAANHNCSDAGTSGHPITRISGDLVGWGTGMAVIDGDAFANECWDVKAGADYLTFNGLEVKNFGNYGIAISSADGFIITGCKVHTRGAGGSGNAEPIFVTGSNGGEISNNEVYDSIWNAINIQNSNNVKILYNYIHGPNGHGGLNIMSDTGSYFGMMDGNDIIGNRVIQMGSVGCLYTRYQRNCLVQNNVFDSSDQNAEYVVYISYGGTGGPTDYDATGYKFFNNLLIGGKWSFANESAYNVEVKNNIMIHPDGTYFVNVYATATSNVFDYNCYYSSSAHFWQWLGGGPLNFVDWKTASGETAAAINANPVMSGYRLGGASPCRNTGISLSTSSGALAYDLVQLARPAETGWEMGPYEYYPPGAGGGKHWKIMNRRQLWR